MPIIQMNVVIATLGPCPIDVEAASYEAALDSLDRHGYIDGKDPSNGKRMRWFKDRLAGIAEREGAAIARPNMILNAAPRH